MEIYQEWVNDDAQTWAASVTFYTIFSLAPLLVLAVAIAGFVFGEDAARGELARQLNSIMGNAGAEVLQDTIADAGTPGSNKGAIASIISLAVLFFGASKIFGELRLALNRIWSVRIDPDASWKTTVQKKLGGFVMVLAVGFLLLVAIILTSFLKGILGLIGGVAEASWFIQTLNQVGSFLVTVLLFGALFKYVPDVKIQWKDVTFGAFWTAVFFTIGKVALGLYITHGDLGSGYGATGSLVVLLAWIFYSVQIFFIGAEFTQVHARHHGHLIIPDKHAMVVEMQLTEPASMTQASTTEPATPELPTP